MTSVSPTGLPSKRSTARRLSPDAPRMLDERGERGSQPGLLRVTQGHERASAALDEERGLAAEQDDVGAGDPRRAPARALRPRERRAVRLRGIGRRQDQRSRPPRRPLAQPLDRAGQRELRAAQALDEVPATADAERLELAELAVDRGVATRDPFGAYAVTGHDPLALEQQLGERARIGLAREEPGGRATIGPASP